MLSAQEKQKVQVFINDKDGKVGNFSALQGDMVYAFHKTHDDITVTLSAGSTGVLVKSGPELERFLGFVKTDLTESARIDTFVLNNVSEADYALIHNSGLLKIADHVIRM